MGKYKHGKPNKETDLQELKDKLEYGHFVNGLRHRAYLVMSYWIGNRRNEPLGIIKEDIREESQSLFVKIPAEKGGIRGGEIELPFSWVGIALLKECWEKTKPEQRLFPFETSTAYRIIKRLWPERTPHWLRYNRVTKMRKLRDQGKIDTDSIKSYTGIQSDRTIERYGMKTQEKIHSVVQVMEE